MTGLRLRSKFLLLFTFISLVPLVLTTALTYDRFQNALNQDAGKSESQLAADAAERVKSFLVSQAGILDTVATLYNPEFLTNASESSKIVENVLYKSDNFTDIDIVDKDGQEILRQDRLSIFGPADLKNIAVSPAFQTVRFKGLYVGPVFVSEGKFWFTLGRWIVDSQGTFSGAVFAQVDGRILQDTMANISAGAGKGGRVYMVNQNGIVVAHPDLSYVLGQRDLSSLPTVAKAAKGGTGGQNSQIYFNELGQDVLGSAYPIVLDSSDIKLVGPLATDWYVVVEQQRSVIFADANRVALFAGLIFMLAAALAIAAAFFFARRISRPVESLYTATEEFSKGNLVYRTKIKTNDEIGDLARNFDNMAKALAKSIRSLKQEERVVSAERDKLSIILSGITNAVIAVDLERNVILFNKAAEQLTGLKARQVTGKPLQSLFKLYDEGKLLRLEQYCPIKKDGSGSEGVAYQKNNLKLVSSGQERSVNLIAGNISEGLSIHLGCILTLQDITREQIIEKTKSEFVSIAAHQLRTPLTGIKWSLIDLFNGETGQLEPPQKKLVGEAVGATERMINLINDLLDVSRIEEGRFGISLKKQPIGPLFKEIEQGLAVTAQKKGITLQFNLPARLPQVNVDKEKIVIVLSNLLDNAIKYSSFGQTVELKAEVKAGELIVSVKDMGIGIPKAEFDRVFSKFFRSTQALLYHTSGSGLGLYVSKNIIEQHGGKIWFESKENQGTTFFFSLPLVS